MIPEATKFLREDKAGLLSSQFQKGLNPNSRLPRFSSGSISHTHVPLISIAVAHDSADCLQLLIKEGANIEFEDGSGWLPVHWACAFRRPRALNILLEAGALTSATNGRASLPLLLVAARYGAVECLQRILAATGGDVGQQDWIGRTAMHFACWFGHGDVVSALVTAHARIDAQDGNGETPLHYACWFGHAKCCATLIENHAALDIQDKSDWTPLHFAAQHNRAEIVRALLAAGANTKIKNSDGRTAESLAVAQNFEDIVQIFADANKQEEKEKPISESRTFVTEFTEEHNHLKDVVKRLAKGRDNQLEQFNSLKDKIEAQQAMISALNLYHEEMRQQIMRLSQTLQAVHGQLLSLQRVREVEIQHPPLTKPAPIPQRPIPKPPEIRPVSSSVAPDAAVNRAQSAQSTRSLPFPSLPMCKLCDKNQASRRCKGCHSPICDACVPLVVRNGCPFCKSNA